MRTLQKDTQWLETVVREGAHQNKKMRVQTLLWLLLLRGFSDSRRRSVFSIKTVANCELVACRVEANLHSQGRVRRHHAPTIAARW